MEIRRATAADLPAITALLADDPLGQTREATDGAAYQAAFQAIDKDPGQFLAVGTEAGEVIATLQLTFIPGLSRAGMLRGQIEAVRIARAYRGQGLGADLFAWAIETCRAKGCGLVQLTTDKTREDAKRFYEGLGFQASHEGMKLPL